MPTVTDFLLKSASNAVQPGVWVRIVNNRTGIAYTSLAVADGNGMFTINNAPPGLYTVYTASAIGGPYVPTGDTAYQVSPALTNDFNIWDYASITATTDVGPLINQATTDAAATPGGRVIIPPPPIGATQYQVATTLVPKSFVEWRAAMGTVLGWVGATNTPFLQNPAVSQAQLRQFNVFGLTFDAHTIAGVGLILNLAYECLWDYFRIRNTNGAAGQVALLIQSLVGTDFNSNTSYCTFRHGRISSTYVGLRCSGLSNAVAVTANFFESIILDDILQTGWDYVGWCDSNEVLHYRIASAGAQQPNWRAIVLNSGAPGAQNGVYNEHFADGFIDSPTGGASQVGVQFNVSSGCSARKLWSSIGPGGSPGQLFVDAGASSYDVELFSHDVGYQTTTASIYRKGIWNQTVPSNVNGVAFFGANTGAAPGVLAGGSTSDANVDLSLQGKGTGGITLGANQANYVRAAGAASLSAPVVAAAGSDANVNLFLQGKGTGLLQLGGNYANFVNVQGNSTGNPPFIAAGGSDANVSLLIGGQGTGSINLGTQFANFMSATGAAAAGTPVFAAAGSDPNIALSVRGKGTGVVQLGAQFANFITALGAAAAGTPVLAAAGSDVNIPLLVNGKGTGSVSLSAQFANFITITGAAAAGTPSLAAAGSDPNINFAINPKGTGVVSFGQQFFNWINISGAVTTGSPYIAATGGDANINLRLIPTGTGVVDFVYATVALGGGAAPTFGTIGGTGPATAAQNSWWKVMHNGVVGFVPIWR